MATLRKKRKLAAVSRETHENTRSSQSHNTLDPEMAQEYISQFSEEIEGGVTETLSKEFSRTESRILGALSEDDEFLLHRQLRTCSVAVPGTSRNSDSENREPNGDRSSNDPCPEARISSHLFGNLNSSEVGEYPHRDSESPCVTTLVVMKLVPTLFMNFKAKVVILKKFTNNPEFCSHYAKIASKKWHLF